MEKVEYQFTQVPTKLMILLDVNCRSMLFTLCQLASHYTKDGGRFFRTNADLSLESRLSQKLVIATLDTLYTHGIVEIWSVGKGKGKHANYFKLNLENECPHVTKLAKFKLPNCPTGMFWNTLCRI